MVQLYYAAVFCLAVAFALLDHFSVRIAWLRFFLTLAIGLFAHLAWLAGHV